MNLTYNDIRKLHEAGNTPQQILDALLADTRHKRDIMATSSDPNVTDMLDLLGSEFRVLSLGADAGWKGPLVDFFAANASHALVPGFELLLTQLQISDRPIRCATSAEIGAMASGLTQVVGVIIEDSPRVQAAMDAVTGGLKYAGTTLTHVEAVLNAETKRATKAAKGGYLNEASFAAEAALSADLSATKADLLAAFTTKLNEVWV